MELKRENRRWSVEKRLEFIDFRLFWEGNINRSDIMERFGVSVPQASNDLSVYQEAAPKNLEYDNRERKYLATKAFKPRFFKPDSNVFLSQLRDDIRLLGVQGEQWLLDVPPHDVVQMPRRNIQPSNLKSVFSAVRDQLTIEVFYQSMSSDEPVWRMITPHAFAFDGMRWHVRAYCHNSEIYKDFLLSRIQDIGKYCESKKSENDDEIWNSFFTVTLVPHPKLSASQAKAVALDYCMENESLKVEVRLALLYYFLRRLGLQDCDGESLSSREQHVVIANKSETKEALQKAQQSQAKEKAVS